MGRHGRRSLDLGTAGHLLQQIPLTAVLPEPTVLFRILILGSSPIVIGDIRVRSRSRVPSLLTMAVLLV